ncbi:MAG: TRAP transporter small permease [Balneolales bacterium]
MEKLKLVIDKYLSWLLIATMAIMVVNVLWQVFSRFFLETPSSVTEELARYLLMWIGLTGGAYAYSQGLHLALDLLTEKLRGRRKAYSGILIHSLIGAFTAGAFIYGGARLVYITLVLDQTSAALQIPMGYVYMAIPVSGMLIVFYSLYYIRENLANVDAPPEHQRDSSDIQVE